MGIKDSEKEYFSSINAISFRTFARALHIVDYLLNNYGWRHKEAGRKYPEDEKSFRQTLCYRQPTLRGFFVDIDTENERVTVKFAPNKIGSEASNWKNELIASHKINYDEDYVPYWGFYDLYHKAGVKLGNCFYITADVTKKFST